MDAPIYPPSDHFEAPRVLAQPITTGDSSFADFLANPAALSILTQEIPGITMMLKNPMIKPHLGNMSPRSVAQFGVAKPEQLDRVDAKLKAAGLMTGASQ